jgi:RND family efflux transporter MFP subunit
MKTSLLPAFILTAAFSTGLSAGETEILTYLRPIRESRLASSESGIVGAVLVKPGDSVSKGQEILRLNMSVIEAQLAQAEALARQEGRLKVAEAEQKMTAQRLDIIEGLRKRGSANDPERDKAIASLAVADGQLMTAREDRESQVLQAATTRAQLEQRILRSPINGIVTEVTREVGESVDSRRADVPDYLAKVVDLSQLVSRVHIPQPIAQQLQLNQKLKLTLDNEAKTEGEGIIRFISPTTDAATGLTEVHLVFDNSKGDLRSGIAATLMVPSPK